MKFNESGSDRIVRVIVGISAIVLIVAQVLTGLPAIILGVVGGILVATGLVGFCPLYGLLRLSTKRAESKN